MVVLSFGSWSSLLKILIVIVITSKAIIMGSLQEHKFFAVTIFLISSTFLRWPVGLLALCSSSFNAISPGDKTERHLSEAGLETWNLIKITLGKGFLEQTFPTASKCHENNGHSTLWQCYFYLDQLMFYWCASRLATKRSHLTFISNYQPLKNEFLAFWSVPWISISIIIPELDLV